MQTKKLGFGLMRLPLNDKTNAGDIDVEQGGYFSGKGLYLL